MDLTRVIVKYKYINTSTITTLLPMLHFNFLITINSS